MQIDGKTSGLKALQIRHLSQIAGRRIKSDQVITYELAVAMTAFSNETGRQLGLLAGRDGAIHAVLVGSDREVMIPDIHSLRFGKRALRGVRLIHTQLKDAPLTQGDLTDLALLRLDLVAVIEVCSDGRPGLLRIAHLIPPNPSGVQHALLPPVSLHQLQLPLNPFLSALDVEFESWKRLHIVKGTPERAILISASTMPRMAQEESLDELSELARSARLVPVMRVIQRPKSLHPKYLIGQGKLKETIMSALQQQADLLIFDQELTPLQVKAIGEVTEMKVLDRTQLILDIFAARARTREARVQVELAQLQHRLPFLSERSTALSRLTGGIGGRGPGETRLEIDRRRAHDRIGRLSREHEALSVARTHRRRVRQDRRIPILSLVGYTNAGKSTLLNALTKSDIETGEVLFETLDTTTRRLKFPREREVILTDTVGFIRSLPSDLLGAFRSTLDELKDAHLLIHVVDISNPRFVQQMETVEQTLGDLSLSGTPVLRVFNKMDRVPPETTEVLCTRYDATAVCALDLESLTPLLLAIEARVWNLEERRMARPCAAPPGLIATAGRLPLIPSHTN
jgi:GTP-binding protein HflX